MPEFLKEWWPVIAVLGPFAVGVLGWIIRQGLASKADLVKEREARHKAIEDAKGELAASMNSVAAAVGKVDGRVAKLEHDFQHLPTKEQVHKLEVTTTEMKGDVKAMNETVKGVAGTASRLESYLLNVERRHGAA